jgi:hypothetical protein
MRDFEGVEVSSWGGLVEVRGRARGSAVRRRAEWRVAAPMTGFLVLVGCGAGSNPGDQNATETDGVVTTSVDGGSDGGSADETGSIPPYYCIYNDANAGLSGVKHQCNLEYDLDVTFTVSLADGSSFQIPLGVTAVQTATDESTYEHPFVMACCTDIRDAEGWPFDDTCIVEHHKACMSDFVQHVCNAPGNWLEAEADDFLFDGKEAIQAAAKWLNDHKQECYDHFWLGQDLLFDADYCVPEYDDFFDHTPWEPTESFIYVLPLTNAVLAEVSNIVVAPRSSFGENVPLEPPALPETCSNPGSNDGEVPPLSSLGTGADSFAPVAPAPIELEGPKLGGSRVRGNGDVGTGSLLEWTTAEAGARKLERWVMTEMAATTASTESARVGVDHFKLTLARPVTAKAREDRWHVEPDAARFVLGATVDGQGSSVQATNATDIELRTVAGGTGPCPTEGGACMESGPFTITYEDETQQSWTLHVPRLVWRP